MPWRYRWTIDTGEEGGRFCREYGFKGGFTDHGQGPFEWFNKWNLRFYNDHTAAKGYLHLRGAGSSRRCGGLLFASFDPSVLVPGHRAAR